MKVTESFETDSFISGLCIFTRKRETPKMIRSDNGVNSSRREKFVKPQTTGISRRLKFSYTKRISSGSLISLVHHTWEESENA